MTDKCLIDTILYLEAQRRFDWSQQHLLKSAYNRLMAEVKKRRLTSTLKFKKLLM